MHVVERNSCIDKEHNTSFQMIKVINNPSCVSLFRNEQTVMVEGLNSNTRYEFAVRLHMDYMSSPWSSPIYLRTLLEGD